jgi:hypothetical protein
MFGHKKFHVGRAEKFHAQGRIIPRGIRPRPASLTLEFPEPRDGHAAPTRAGPRRSTGPLERLGLHFEGFFRLDREADRNIGRTIEHLEHLIAKQATKRAFGARPRGQLDAAIAGIAGRTGDVGFLHSESMPRAQAAFQPAGEHKIFSKPRLTVRSPILKQVSPARRPCRPPATPGDPCGRPIPCCAWR